MSEDGTNRTLLWCFNHEMRAALAFRSEHPDLNVAMRNARRAGPDNFEAADRVFASTYCYGRIARLYEGSGIAVEEVWLGPEYRHRVDVVDGGYQLMEKEGGWRAVGEPQSTEEEAWAILDKKELGL